MTERFIVDIDEAIVDKLNKTEYCTWEVKGVEDICELLNSLNDENEQLQIKIADLKYDNKNYKINLNDQKRENKELKQRNNRQYEQLGRLYNLIEQKDWRALNDILDDFKKCEEQLQKEWGTYGDVE